MRPAAADWRPHRVLIGYDGTEGGRDAVALAAALAEPDAELLLVDVIPPVGIFTLRPRRLEDEEPPQSQGFFLEALRDLSGREVETRTYLIVVGSRGYGTVGRVLVGSVATGLLHKARCPVLTVPRPRPSAEENESPIASAAAIG